MRKQELLWVGLKLLGGYFLVLGVGQAMAGGTSLYMDERSGDAFSAWIWRSLAYRQIVPACIQAAAGGLLLVGAGWVTGLRPAAESDGSSSGSSADAAETPPGPSS